MDLEMRLQQLQGGPLSALFILTTVSLKSDKNNLLIQFFYVTDIKKKLFFPLNRIE